MSYAEWTKKHNEKIEAAIKAKNVKEAERLMVEADGFDQIDWSK